jgi:hypothetical protein
VIPGTTPSAPDDDGAADPALEAALVAGQPPEIGLAMLQARLLLPVVAVRTAGEADMAVPAIVDAEGRRALPVFSSYDALRAWQPDGRPVPMPGARVLAAAVDEGYAGVVLDVAGPVAHTVTGPELAALSAAGRALLADPTARVALADT